MNDEAGDSNFTHEFVPHDHPPVWERFRWGYLIRYGDKCVKSKPSELIVNMVMDKVYLSVNVLESALFYISSILHYIHTHN